MKNILYVVAVLLIFAWGVGYLLYNVESILIHLLLVIAVVAILVNIYRHKKST